MTVRRKEVFKSRPGRRKRRPSAVLLVVAKALPVIRCSCHGNVLPAAGGTQCRNGRVGLGVIFITGPQVCESSRHRCVCHCRERRDQSHARTHRYTIPYCSLGHYRVVKFDKFCVK